MRHVSQLNRDRVENLFDVLALDSARFAVHYDQDKAWRFIISHGKTIVMGEFAGSWVETEISVSDTAHSLVMFLSKMLGGDPKDKTFDAKAELSAERVESRLGAEMATPRGHRTLESVTSGVMHPRRAVLMSSRGSRTPETAVRSHDLP